MRVGFDGRDLLRKRTGVVNYAVHLAEQLSRLPGAELLVYTDRFVDPAVSPPAGASLRRIGAPPALWKHLALPAMLLRDRADLFHSPTGTLPVWAPTRQVVTIHDLFCDIHPEWFPGRMAWHLQRSQRRAARSAAAIIAVSERTRRDVARYYGVPPQRVRVIHNGVDARRFSGSYAEPELDRVARRYGVSRPFVLCVGSLMPWRNAPRLLRAVAHLREREGLPHQLLFVGRDIWGTDPTRRMADERGWGAWARLAGYAPDDDLPILYAAADVFAYPSLYEGFGIPPLEAMASGTPVVAGDDGAIPEVLGDAAVLVDPWDEEALAAGLLRAIRDVDLRAELRGRGRARAGAFTWERAAAETLSVYRDAIA